MKENIKKAQDIILERVSLICRKFGLNHIMAQLYVILYFSDKSLSLDDMVERLGISKGTASINIRMLERYGAARRVLVKGTRKDYYEAEIDIAKVAADRIKAMAASRFLEIGEAIESSNEAVGSVELKDSGEDSSVLVFKERAEKLKALYGQARSIFELFNAGVLNMALGATSGQTKEDTNYQKTV